MVEGGSDTKAEGGAQEKVLHSLSWVAGREGRHSEDKRRSTNWRNKIDSDTIDDLLSRTKELSEAVE